MHAKSTTSVPTLCTTSKHPPSGAQAGEKNLRRTISITAFPQPPRGSSQIASLYPSVLSGGAIPASPIARRDTPQQNRPVTTGGSLRLKRPKTLGSNPTQISNGIDSSAAKSGKSKSMFGGSDTRVSDGYLSLPSPPQSRSSSAGGSHSTNSTAFEDLRDSSTARGREDLHGTVNGGRRHSKSEEPKGNVIVSVRVRPNAGAGEDTKAEGDWIIDRRRALISFRGREGGDCFYDNVFATRDNNAKVYDSSAKRLVRRVMEGYHGTVFAYGMTGTGKTFSMQGTTTSPGVIPLAITDIFSYIRETPHREFLLRVSYLEIYNERIHDLLSLATNSGSVGNGTAQQEEIKLREDAKRGVYATPLREEIVQSPTQLLRVIARGDHARRTASTLFNARSSRSHAVVQIVVESRDRLPGNEIMQSNKRSATASSGVRVSTLSLIDLAGSERAAESKERRTEGSHINKSLLTLGTVVARLSGDKDKDKLRSEKDDKHLPYRDSKLTRLLQPALSGNSLISILCTIQIGSVGSADTANGHAGETLNTLKFAARAKNNIVSHAKRAEEALGSGSGDTGSRVLLERYRMEIQELRGQLDGQAKKSEYKEEERQREKEAEQRHEEQMLEMQLARTALKERIEHLNRLILCSKSTGVNSSGASSGIDMQQGMPSIVAGEIFLPSACSSSSQSPLEASPGSLNRTASVGSLLTSGHMSVRRTALPPPTGNPLDDEDCTGEFGNGTASLTAQIQALQADLVDKHRYISTLEKRLLQARRSSHSRTSLCLSPPHKAIRASGEEHGAYSVLNEKNVEIADLRARLDDKERMVTALRSAARKRDFANSVSAPANADSCMILEIINQERKKLSMNNYSNESRRMKSGDEMSKMLDEMIQDRVESGHLVKSTGGSIRVASKRRSEGTTMAIEALKSSKSNELPSEL
ncbi:MAG: hypothetical protein M1827_000791 [Pycnora praestabilis]|nr:MAG: hypothetical protein M1827_000791 [Pycnora praestabilis]